MYKNLEKVYVERFEDINRNENLENKLYVLKYPHDRHYRKWIYNKWCNRLEPLTWLDKLFEFKHAPAKLDKVDNTHDYIKVYNENRTQADGLDPDLYDHWQQHHLIDTKVLDETIDDLKAYKHVPGKLDKLDEKYDYIKVLNENRTQEDGLKEGLVDNEQQHFILDTSKLDEVINNIDNPKGGHVPSKLEKADHSHQYILVENKNRTVDDGLDPELTDVDEQLHVINTKGLDDALDKIREESHVPGKIDLVDGAKDYLSVKNENREELNDLKQQHFMIDTSKMDKELDKAHVPAKLEKADNEFDYITVDNINRTTDDGLPTGLIDELMQKHILNTSKLDFVLDNLQVNNGTETILFEGPKIPPDGSSLDLGNVSEFNDVKVYYRSSSMSVNQSVNFITPEPNQKTSFVLMNIGDNDNTQPLVTCEVGQTLANFNSDLTKCTLTFTNTNVLRFRNNIGTGANGSFNTIDSAIKMQPEGSIAIGNAHPPHSSLPGNGWVEVIKVTGVVYGSLSIQKSLEILINRLTKKDYVVYQDFNRYVKYVISSRSEKQLELLDHLERFETELRNEPITAKASDNKTRYDYLIEYREELRKGVE